LTTPTKQEIIEHATEMFKTDRCKSGDPSWNLTPEISELAEAGYLQSAKSELMYSPETKYEPYLNCDNFEDFSLDVNEALKSGVYASGTTGSGKSDIAMYVVDAIKKQYPDAIFVVFDPSQDWQRSSIQRVQTLKSAFIDSIPQQSIIYDISTLSIRESQKLIEDFSNKLMQQQADQHGKQRYFIIFEEAHSYFPEGCLRSRNYENAVRLMTQGRNFKVRFMCITQFAALLDKQAMRYMRQRYFGFTDEPNDVDYISRIIGNEAQKLSSLEAGQFLYWHGKLCKIHIEPYTCNIAKKQIAAPQPQPLPKVTVQPKQADMMPILKFVFISVFALIWLWSMI
jgi:hypothetical protein